MKSLKYSYTEFKPCDLAQLIFPSNISFPAFLRCMFWMYDIYGLPIDIILCNHDESYYTNNLLHT